MELIWQGHSCFQVKCGGKEILIDPFLSGNPQSIVKPEELHPDLILVTHGHGDHLGDALQIAANSGAVLAAQVDLINVIPHPGIETVAFNLGGTFRFGDICITMVPAWHGSTVKLAAGTVAAGVACGYVIDDGEKKVYHAGDTALFGDMSAVISRYGLDCALLPIGDFYTMGPEDAVTAAQWLKAGTVIPMHYDTFPAIRQDAAAFACRVEAETDSSCRVLRIGEHFTL